MVQIKDSVLRDSGFRKTFPPPLRLGLRIHAIRIRRSGRTCHPDAMPRKTPAPRFRCGISTADVNNLSTTCQECLYVVDFRRVVRLSKKARKIRKICLTFQKAVHPFRIIGTIQPASSIRGGGRSRAKIAESLLHPSFASCRDPGPDTRPGGPSGGCPAHCQQVSEKQP